MLRRPFRTPDNVSIVLAQAPAYIGRRADVMEARQRMPATVEPRGEGAEDVDVPHARTVTRPI
jgi:hypothetical protein